MKTTRARHIFFSLEGLTIGAIYVLSWWVVSTQLFLDHQGPLGLAILIDLTLTAGILHYFFGIRGAGLPAWTLLPVVGTGYALAGILAPESFRQGSLFFVLIAAAIELTAAVFVLIRISEIVRGYHRARQLDTDPWLAHERSLGDVLGYPKLASAVRLECEIFWLAVAGWFRRPVAPVGVEIFTVYKRVSWFPLVGALLFLSGAEFGMVHYFLIRAGWMLGATISLLLHAYGVLWLLGDAQALRLRPVAVSEEAIKIQIGLRWRCFLHPSQVQQVDLISESEPDGFSMVLMGKPNAALSLREPVEIQGLFDIRRTADRLLLQLDDRDGFANAVARVSD